MRMDWRDVQQAWQDLGDQIQDRWPAVQALDLAMIAGDKQRFTAYLADVHELTLAEAQEVIELWLYRVRGDLGERRKAG